MTEAREKLEGALELLRGFLLDNTDAAFEEIPDVDSAKAFIEEA